MPKYFIVSMATTRSGYSIYTNEVTLPQPIKNMLDLDAVAEAIAGIRKIKSSLTITRWQRFEESDSIEVCHGTQGGTPKLFVRRAGYPPFVKSASVEEAQLLADNLRKDLIHI